VPAKGLVQAAELEHVQGAEDGEEDEDGEDRGHGSLRMLTRALATDAGLGKPSLSIGGSPLNADH
jgi:hypothetical protein